LGQQKGFAADSSHWFLHIWFILEQLKKN